MAVLSDSPASDKFFMIGSLPDAAKNPKANPVPDNVEILMKSRLCMLVDVFMMIEFDVEQ